MKSCLADINVMLALLAAQHDHHARARKWFASCAKGEIYICRYVQLGVIRLLSNRDVMGRSVLTGFAAYRVIHELIDFDERVEFMNDPANLDAIFPEMLSHPAPATKAVNDAFLSAFAVAANIRLVTFDRGFQQYKRLDLSLLEK